MEIGVVKLKYEAEPTQPPILTVTFLFGGVKSDTAHKAAAINSWFTHGGAMDIKYDAENDAMILSKKKY